MSQTAEGNRNIGIAGYMGAGKSTCAARIHLTLGVRIIDADAEAKALMQNDDRIRRNLERAFGPSVVASGAVSFAALSALVFSSAEKMQRLNDIVHPPLLDKLRALIVSLKEPVVLDAALIPLWHIEPWFGRCLWVTAPASVRCERLRKKTSLGVRSVRRRMALQEAMVKAPSGPAWTIIGNQGTLSELLETTDGWCRTYRPA
jgi:dephospho-CoA kinase